MRPGQLSNLSEVLQKQAPGKLPSWQNMFGGGLLAFSGIQTRRKAGNLLREEPYGLATCWRPKVILL